MLCARYSSALERCQLYSWLKYIYWKQKWTNHMFISYPTGQVKASIFLCSPMFCLLFDCSGLSMFPHSYMFLIRKRSSVIMAVLARTWKNLTFIQCPDSLKRCIYLFDPPDEEAMSMCSFVLFFIFQEISQESFSSQSSATASSQPVASTKSSSEDMQGRPSSLPVSLLSFLVPIPVHKYKVWQSLQCNLNMQCEICHISTYEANSVSV